MKKIIAIVVVFGVATVVGFQLKVPTVKQVSEPLSVFSKVQGISCTDQLCAASTFSSVDSLSGTFFLTEDLQAYVLSGRGDSVLLEFPSYCPIVGDGNRVLLFGKFEHACPIDRRFCDIFVVENHQKIAHPPVATSSPQEGNQLSTL